MHLPMLPSTLSWSKQEIRSKHSCQCTKQLLLVRRFFLHDAGDELALDFTLVDNANAICVFIDVIHRYDLSLVKIDIITRTYFKSGVLPANLWLCYYCFLLCFVIVHLLLEIADRFLPLQFRRFPLRAASTTLASAPSINSNASESCI